MNEYVLKIMLLMVDMNYGEVLKKITQTVENTYKAKDFILLLVNYTQAEQQYKNGLMRNEEFAIKKAQIADGIYFFLEKLPEPVLIKILRLLQPNNINETNGSHNLVYNLLLVAALPYEMEALSTNREFTKIEEKIKLTPGNPCVKVVKIVLAASFGDLIDNISSYKPTIVHFAGHGSTENLSFETKTGEVEAVSINTLGDLLAEYKDTIQCTLLNACESASASKISEYDIYVICMNQPIQDEAAINFSTAFYSLLSRGENFEKSFRLACIQLQVSNWDQRNIPELWFKGQKILRN